MPAIPDHRHAPTLSPHPFSVAPMLDCTDRHFRVLMRQVSSEALLYTEMVVAQALHYGHRQRLLDYDPVEHPLALQVGGDDPLLLAEAARMAEVWGYDELNLNLGCPSERVQAGRFGACLMAEPDHVARCIEAMATTSLPVTVKHRLGIDHQESYDHLLAFVDTTAAAGAQRFIVHARKAWLQGLNPKQNRTIPPLRYDWVARLKQERPHLCIVLNGGLTTMADCRQALTLCDGAMVGRAAYDHPLCWADVDAVFYGHAPRHPLRPSAVVEAMIPYAQAHMARGGRLWDVARHLLQLVQGVPGARAWRRRLGEGAMVRGAGLQVLQQAAEALMEHGW
ncbi:MAG: tRNA dihydrouridine(20/20a) synthase DusA [Synechococcus sp. SB0668_bin_13]|uniref:tRNA-dihydrouridine(20/20a) synthase n=1 Tax=Synechococcus sp. SB0676_bin_10 TaxID=2604869 RepID=A0A6B1FCH9_9SYNE|nr:tRNA dihydrouridine(20/20a) synthase DusA [Cyanobacteria bacterium MAG IRC4_bin_6]MXW11292.1 tRNA dihydrouridine(20/20a) synthase DusA [Synechococcus sp. SB0668_bin_13]MXY19223.1 tRNA dihydrouridine(20/20a) synthase DusA [Synechococcus sp. SB0664_bin_36]MYG38002.1 tRNA dihydrouridine(20/20a) synthase DusA [Synechococcus sp. SB0676_bin_10]MYK07158.1 tRNA dihydrouridine(20/20a) synthase DusA [Synechococcus sp. SB0670_bin_20]